MFVESQLFIYCIHSDSYVNKLGLEVEFLKVFYFDKDSYEDSKFWKGYKVQNLDVLSQGFNLSDFQGPGFYKAVYSPSLYRGKVRPKFKEFQFVKNLDFSKSDGVLVLGVKPFSFTPEDSKDLKVGIKVFTINLDDFQENEFWGYPELSFSYDGKLQDFRSVPGFYNLDISSIRGRNGESILKANKFSFLAPFAFQVASVA